MSIFYNSIDFQVCSVPNLLNFTTMNNVETVCQVDDDDQGMNVLSVLVEYCTGMGCTPMNGSRIIGFSPPCHEERNMNNMFNLLVSRPPSNAKYQARIYVYHVTEEVTVRIKCMTDNSLSMSPPTSSNLTVSFTKSCKLINCACMHGFEKFTHYLLTYLAIATYSVRLLRDYCGKKVPFSNAHKFFLENGL